MRAGTVRSRSGSRGVSPSAGHRRGAARLDVGQATRYSTPAPGLGAARPLPLSVVRVASWNVNSAKIRVPRLLPWCDQRQPDVVCLQETKLADDAFGALLGAELERRGYAVALHGEAQWNGVAILSRVGLDDIVTGVANGPGFPLPEARAVSATCGGVRGTSGDGPPARGPDSHPVPS